jgi:hypothetical protein
MGIVESAVGMVVVVLMGGDDDRHWPANRHGHHEKSFT